MKQLTMYMDKEVTTCSVSSNILSCVRHIVNLGCSLYSIWYRRHWFGIEATVISETRLFPCHNILFSIYIDMLIISITIKYLWWFLVCKINKKSLKCGDGSVGNTLDYESEGW